MRLIAILLLASTAANVGAAEVYRTISPDGTVIYSDRPRGPNSEPIYVAAYTPVPAPIPVAAAPSADRSAASAPDTESLSEVEAQRIERDLAEQRERNCAIARSRVENYSAARRLYRELPDGEREYLDDAEMDEARARAAADVEAWCS